MNRDEILQYFPQYPAELINKILDDMGIEDKCSPDDVEKIETALEKIKTKTKAIKGGAALTVASPEVKSIAVEIESDFSLGISRKTISLAMSALAINAINDADQLTSTMNAVFVERVRQNQEGFVEQLTSALNEQSRDFRKTAQAIAEEILKQATPDKEDEDLKEIQQYIATEAKKTKVKSNPFEEDESNEDGFDFAEFMRASGFDNYGKAG